MFSKHVARNLSAYHHGELHADEKAEVESHLPECAKCRAAYDEIRAGARLASMLSPSKAPESIWIGITKADHPVRSRQWVPQFAVGLAMAAVVALSFFLVRYMPQRPSWEVVTVRGALKVGRLHLGESLQTDASSEAEIKIANIGELTMDPNTKIRLLVTKSDQHRIALDRGKVEARTWAPPRLFIVDTPSATAIDLGCRYTLEVEDDGSSLLHVTLGLVALELHGRETVVPAGALCRTRKGAGPGTPFFEDSSIPLQSALKYLDSAKEGPERTRQLEIVLRESRIRDGLTLWHLIPRLDAQSRSLVYDRLSQLIPPPPEVTRDGIVALDAKMLDAWKPLVAQLWQ